MIVRINDRYQIVTDPLQYTIQFNRASRERRNQGKNQWTSMRYYTTLCGAVNGLIEMDLRSVELESLCEAVKRSKTLVRDLTAALLPRYEVIPVRYEEDRLQSHDVPK